MDDGPDGAHHQAGVRAVSPTWMVSHVPSPTVRPRVTPWGLP